MKVRIGIWGATGYTGYELVQWLRYHPHVAKITAVTSSAAGQNLRHFYPQAPDLPLVSDLDPQEIDVAFLCLPHVASAVTAVTLLAAGVTVIDLSADFRLKDATSYAHWYGQEHPAPQWLDKAVYGLTEFARPALAGAKLVANPGCYPTSVLLGVQPLLAQGLAVGTIIADCKSGVSGAGRTPQASTHFMAVDGNFAPYKIGHSHRHVPEIEQGFRLWNTQPPALLFSPHLLPVPRGILSTIYVPLAHNMSWQALQELYEASYASEPFVQVLPPGELATLAHVVNSNRCAIGLTLVANSDSPTLIITSAIDNLVKGAAGQAIQNMNVVMEWDETLGLRSC